MWAPVAYVASLLFAWAVSRRLKMRAVSPYWVFLLFQTLYIVTPWAMARLGFAPPFFRLLSDQALSEKQMLFGALANICFVSVFLAAWRPVRFLVGDHADKWDVRRRYLLWSFPVFAVVTVLAHFYGWHAYTAAGVELADLSSLGGMFTVTAYAKFLFVTVYLYYLYRFGLDRGAWILLAEHVVLLMADGARATFLPVVLFTLFLLLDKTSDPKVLRRVSVLAAGGIILSIAARSLVITDESMLMKLAVPVGVEGGMGAYPSLQSLAGIEHAPHARFTLGASYVVDPLVWLVPKAVGRGDLLSFDRWQASIVPALEEPFAPMGGFYYLSEAFAAFGYWGPAVVTTLFAGSLVWMERRKNRYPMLYLCWMPTVGLMFVKTQFGNVVKLCLIQLVCVHGLSALHQVRLYLYPCVSPATAESSLDVPPAGAVRPYYNGGVST